MSRHERRIEREDFRGDWDPRWSIEDEREYDSLARERLDAEGGPEFEDSDYCTVHECWRAYCWEELHDGGDPGCEHEYEASEGGHECVNCGDVARPRE